MTLVITDPVVCEGPKCELALGQDFTLAVEFMSVPTAGYILAQSWVEFGTFLTHTATTDPGDEVAWPECGDEAILVRANPQDGNTRTNHACLTSLFAPHPPSFYVGPFLQLSFECSAFASSNDVSLLPAGQPPAGTSGALYKDAHDHVRLDGHDSDIVPEVGDPLTINCVAGLPTVPTSTTGPTTTHTPTPTIDPSATDTPPPTITDAPEPGATAMPTDVGAPTSTPDATVAAMTPTSTSTLTPAVDEQGTPLPTSTRTPASQQVGDASCNGTVDPLDAALILQFAAGLTLALPCPSQADASRDGNVNPLDAALVLQFSAGLLDALPV